MGNISIYHSLEKARERKNIEILDLGNIWCEWKIYLDPGKGSLLPQLYQLYLRLNTLFFIWITNLIGS